MNKRLLFLTVFMIAALSAASCKTAEFGYKVFDINGMVYDFSNWPIAHCEVSLGRRGLTGTSDINGRFSIHRVPLGNYTLTVYKDGYEKYSEVFSIKQRGQIIYVRIPSQTQLLDLVDEALKTNNYTLAEEMADRAYQIDPNNMETLFYFATVKYKRHDYKGALALLEAAVNLGSKDPYIEKFIMQLMEIQNANS